MRFRLLSLDLLSHLNRTGYSHVKIWAAMQRLMTKIDPNRTTVGRTVTLRLQGYDIAVLQRVE